ncbi:F0F1 ATP synthase subunit delta [Solicola sp. PLA-1-18]|uniref:F0F1 ATP synthase subunit delta n=1 Tax=Solicola sp. PLA-1-18 TaxID=3380532 RepID=UPI003B809AE5
MRGASAGSLATVLSAVDAAVDGGADSSALGDELFAVAGALDGAPPLRRVLTDPSTDDAAKQGLAAQVFGDKVSSAAADVLSAAVTGRWGSSRDLPDALEEAGATAHVVGADQAGHLDDLEDELFRFGRVVAGDPELRRSLTDRSIPAAPKLQLVGTLLDGKASAGTVALARQAVLARGGSFERAVAQFGDIAAGRRSRLLATVRTAYELGEEEKERLAAALGRQYGRDVHVNTVVDPTVLGGIAVEIGDEIIDGTVAGRLEDARRRIGG